MASFSGASLQSDGSFGCDCVKVTQVLTACVALFWTPFLRASMQQSARLSCCYLRRLPGYHQFSRGVHRRFESYWHAVTVMSLRQGPQLSLFSCKLGPLVTSGWNQDLTFSCELDSRRSNFDCGTLNVESSAFAGSSRSLATSSSQSRGGSEMYTVTGGAVFTSSYLFRLST